MWSQRPWSKRSLAICGAVCATAAAGLFGISASCTGTPAKRSTTPTSVSTPAPTPQPVHGRKVAGVWSWSHQQEKDGVRRVERERWELQVERRRLIGSYRRDVTFLAVDGAPFACNQDLRYTLVTQYQVEGTLNEKHVDLREVSFQAVPSPCERGVRRLATYRAIASDGTLVLSWNGGSQTLRRLPGQKARPVAADDGAKLAARRASASGRWQWRNRTESRFRKEVRVEAEEWELTDDDKGGVTGTYLRSVTVFNEQGSVYACSGKTYYRYRDRYTVVATRHGDTLRLKETAVDADTHECLQPRKQRHLDAASGKVYRDYLVLDWRGRRQVLRRPPLPLPARAQR